MLTENQTFESSDLTLEKTFKVLKNVKIFKFERKKLGQSLIKNISTDNHGPIIWQKFKKSRKNLLLSNFLSLLLKINFGGSIGH